MINFAVTLVEIPDDGTVGMGLTGTIRVVGDHELHELIRGIAKEGQYLLLDMAQKMFDTK